MGDGEKGTLWASLFLCYFFQNFHQGHSGKAPLFLCKECPDNISLAEKIRLYGIEENQKKETVFIAACRFVSADKDLTPQKAIEKALRLWDIIEA